MIHFDACTLIRVKKDDLEKPIQDALCNRHVYGKINDGSECIYKAGIFQELLDEIEHTLDDFDEKAKDQLTFIAAAVADAEFVLIR